MIRLILLSLFAYVGVAAAHETWLLPGAGRLAAPGVVSFSVSSGMDFPKPDTAIDPARIVRSGVRQAGAVLPLEPLRVLGGNAFFRARLPATGVAAAFLELPPIRIELTPELVKEYLEEIQAGADVRAAWAAQQAAGVAFRERYTKFASAFVAVGEADDGWRAPLGGPIEIVPLADPTRLAPGTELPVRVLKEGLPFAGLPVALMEAGERRWLRTDADGRVTFRVQTTGPWLVHCTELRPPAEGENEWRSWFATLSLR